MRPGYGKLLCAATPAFAFLMISLFPAHAASYIREGGATKKPYAHHVFCDRSPRDCRSNPAVEPLALTPSLMKTLAGINQAVNRSITPISDLSQHGKVDVWTAGARAGDCEDYAIAKRRKLIAAGFGAANLRFTMVMQRNGEAHLVLAVRTDQGDLILDNLRDDILPFRKTGYRFVKIQDGQQPREWNVIR